VSTEEKWRERRKLARSPAKNRGPDAQKPKAGQTRIPRKNQRKKRLSAANIKQGIRMGEYIGASLKGGKKKTVVRPSGVVRTKVGKLLYG